VYSLIYEGDQLKYEAAALVPGRVYRFVVSGVNNVGEGNSTAAFAAKMHCTPRTLAGSPTKVTGSDTRIVITWPETTNNCGATVQSYRIYRNSDLLYPISNRFTATPTLARLTSDTVEVTVFVESAGTIWLGLFETTQFMPTVRDLKAGKGVGRAPCRRLGVAVVPGENHFTLYGCNLGAGWQYSYELHSYVEGMDGAEDDGSRAPSVTLPKIYASNRFIEPVKVTAINKQNMTLTFKGQEEAGRYWIMIVLPRTSHPWTCLGLRDC
jgi:hypothetical protein